jgi:ABC-type nitrate/sulfonate/bicarbonate transport system permease component
VSVLLFFAAWEAIVVYFNVPAYQAPRPLDAVRAVTTNWSTLAPLVAGTLQRLSGATWRAWPSGRRSRL